MTAQYAAGPERFLASTAGPKPSVWRSLLSGFLLLLLIVGVPALLVMTVGLPPLPHDLDVSVLTRAISLETLLALLVWVVWLAWLQFAVCTAVETVSALRGRGMPVHVPLSGGIQGLARRLVITTLLVGAIGAPVAAAAPVAEAPSQAASISQQVDATGAQESAPDAGAAGAAGAGSGTSDGSTQGQENVRYMLGDTELDQETGAQLVGQRVYVVQPPEGRYHDNLWDIAERNLGDGRAYSQIYDLNVGRVQYDGRSLELARLIQPGWLLAMPESATNVDRVVAVPDVNPAPAPPVDQTTDQSGGSMVDDTAGRQEILPAEAPAVGSLLAASLLAVLARRRRQWAGARPGDDAADFERLLRVGADEHRTRRLDAILRSLPGLPEVPMAYAVAIDDDACYLRLARPLHTAPAPWHVQEEGMTWRIDAGAEPELGLGPALLPGLVTIGRNDHGADVLIDLGFAAGDIAVTGDPTMAAELVAAIALELCTNPWSADATVAGTGLSPALQEVVGERIQHPDAIATPAPTPHAGGVLTGRHPGAVTTFVLAADGQVPAVMRTRPPVGFVRVGAVEGARWSVSVDASGTAHIAPLGISVTATRATERELMSLVGLLGPSSVRDGDDNGRPPVPDPPQPPIMLAALRAAPVRIQVLGQTVVDAPGALERSRRTVLTEAAACIALHPQGIRPAVLGAMLWPLGVTSDVVEETITRLRQWLGQDAQGVPHLREDADGRLRLGPGAVLDWDVLRSLLAASRAAPPQREVELLMEALRLVRGPVGQDAPEGRYSWLARVRTDRQASSLVVDAAHRLVELLGDTDPDGAATAVNAGLRVVDLNQTLWRDRLRLAARRGAGELERDVAALLDASGADDLSQVDPATAALVEHMAPGTSVRRRPA